jgi:drug/metabolite transporter (DMT)-like permease
VTLPQVRERWAALPANIQGALWMMLSCLGFSIMASFVKLAAREIGTFEITFFRCFFGLLVLTPVILWRGPSVLVTRHLGMHAWRGLLGSFSMMCAYFGISRLELASYTALSFTKPLFAIVLAVIVLRETVRWRRWGATAVGFVGVLIMMRPGTAAFDPNALFALADALSIAILITVLKRLPAYEKPFAMLFYFGVIASPLALIPAVMVGWQWPSLAVWLLLIAIGITGALSQYWWILAFRAGEASAVAPFDYSRLIFTGFVGLVFFSEVPDGWTLAGAGLIVASTVYIARREARIAPAPAKPETVIDT